MAISTGDSETYYQPGLPGLGREYGEIEFQAMVKQHRETYQAWALLGEPRVPHGAKVYQLLWRGL